MKHHHQHAHILYHYRREFVPTWHCEAPTLQQKRPSSSSNHCYLPMNDAKLSTTTTTKNINWWANWIHQSQEWENKKLAIVSIIYSSCFLYSMPLATCKTQYSWRDTHRLWDKIKNYDNFNLVTKYAMRQYGDWTNEQMNELCVQCVSVFLSSIWIGEFE